MKKTLFNKSQIISIFVTIGLLGCSPALNWRQLPIGSSQAMLPCKPDQAKRIVPLAGVQVEISMVGCEADGAVFAISYVQTDTTEKARKIMQSWKDAAVSNIQGKDVQLLDMSNTPLAKQTSEDDRIYLRVHGADANGKPTQAQLQWIIVGTEVYHWAVYAEKIKPEVLEPMFEH